MLSIFTPTEGIRRLAMTARLTAMVVCAAWIALSHAPASSALTAVGGFAYGDETATLFEDQEITAVAHDSAGNIYIGGNFRGRLNLGDGVKFSQGGTDIFVAKFSPTGVILWSVQGGGTGLDHLNDIDVTPDGSLAVVGDTASPLFSIGTGAHTTNGQADAFAALFGSTGTYSWSGTWGGPWIDSAHSVVRPSGTSFYVAGIFRNTVDFGVGLPRTSSGLGDFFLLDVKIWGAMAGAITAGGTGDEDHARICVDSAGDVFFAGSFQNTINFGTGPVTAGGEEDVCLLKVTSFTSPAAWVRSMGGVASPQWCHVGGIATDGSSVYLTGSFAGQADLGGGLIGTTGAADLFVTAYKSTGVYQWSFSGGSLDDDGGNDIAYHNGQLAVGGFIRDDATFGAIQIPYLGFSHHALLLMCTSGGTIISGHGAEGSHSVTSQVAVNDAGVNAVGLFVYEAFFDGVSLIGAGTTDDNGYLVQYQEPVVGVEADNRLAANSLYLGPAYPNPTGGGTKFALQSNSIQIQSAQVVDFAGRVVRRISVGSASGGVLHWDGRTDTGRSAATGVYFMRISDGKSVEQRRIILIR